jgi:drug/metabolite transporter (DMT)-like permease
MAFRLDRPPRLAPFFYIALVISILAGILVFDEWPAYSALAGMGLIAGAGIIAARQSARS